MPVIVYIDETGDHSLGKIDPSFPTFCLTLLVCEISDYIGSIVPRANTLKFQHWGHENVILHSRDIRKAQGPFAIMRNPATQTAVMADLDDLMRNQPYQLIAVVIDKAKHAKRYATPNNPYELSMLFALERLVPLLENLGQTDVTLIAESRGAKEDADLRNSFLSTVYNGTGYVSAIRFRRISFTLEFCSKKANCIGTQMADLAGYPISRRIITPKGANAPFAILRQKFYRGPGLIRGLKVFP